MRREVTGNSQNMSVQGVQSIYELIWFQSCQTFETFQSFTTNVPKLTCNFPNTPILSAD
jgi:hypothetical protein